MNSVILLTALCGQVPSPQMMSQAPPGPPQTLVLLQYAVPPTPAAPSILAASPPIWDRAAAHLGRRPTDRAVRHQHPRPVTAAVAYQDTGRAGSVRGTLRALASPSAQAASEAVPTPPNFVTPASNPILRYRMLAAPTRPRLFGSG